MIHRESSQADMCLRSICHIIIYLSYIFLSDKFAYLISYVESNARSPSAPTVVIWFFVQAKKPYHPHDLVICVFCMGKKSVSPT